MTVIFDGVIDMVGETTMPINVFSYSLSTIQEV